MPDPSRGRGRAVASTFGLLLALGSPFVLPLFPGQAHRTVTDAGQDVVLVAFEWSVALTILAIVVFWERLPLRSIGMRKVRWRDAGAAVVTMLAILAAGALLFAVAGSTDPSRLAGVSSAQIAAVPLGLRIALFLTAGFCEELMFRAYAIERLAMFSGKLWVGGLVTAVLFTLGHVPRYGWSVSLAGVFIIGTFLTVLYVRQRNLWLCAAVHAASDAMGLVIGPAFALHAR